MARTVHKDVFFCGVSGVVTCFHSFKLHGNEDHKAMGVLDMHCKFTFDHMGNFHVSCQNRKLGQVVVKRKDSRKVLRG